MSAKNGKETAPAVSTPPEPVPAEPPAVVRPQTLPDLRIAVSPAQAAVGFGIIASLIMLVLRRRRKRG